MRNIIIVTGGAGFIGSHLIEILIKKTFYQIISLDNYSTGSKKNHIQNERVRYIAMNMLPKDSLVTTEEAYRKVKHNIGDNYKWAWPKQHLVYKPDTYKNILSEFKDFTNEEKNQ